jgi:hypothetical protein
MPDVDPPKHSLRRRCEKEIRTSQHLGGDQTWLDCCACERGRFWRCSPGITSVWAWDVRWLRLACAAGLMVGIAQQLGELTRLATSRLTETLQR